MLELGHTSSDGHVIKFIGLFEVVEKLEFGVIFFLCIFFDVKPK